MNTKVIIVSVVLILAGICGTTALAGAVFGANSTALRGLLQVSNNSTDSGGLISPTPTVIVKSPPSIYTFEQYLQILLDANDGSATISMVAKGGVLTISSPSIDLKSDTMTLTASNFKYVIDKNTGHNHHG